MTGSGCSYDDTSSRRHDSSDDRIVYRAPNHDQDSGHDHDWDHDHDHDRDHDRRPSSVPRDADVVKEGTGRLVFRPDRPGTVWVYDVERDKVVFSGDAGHDVVVVNPDENGIRIGQHNVSADNLHRGDVYRIYWLRSR